VWPNRVKPGFRGFLGRLGFLLKCNAVGAVFLLPVEFFFNIESLERVI